MIHVPTAFVLGAGASVPYGFPTGRGLLFEIAQDLAPGTNSNLKRDLDQRGYSAEQAELFRNELLNSHLLSVDAFLENREVFADIGKIAIAIKLIRKETERMLIRGKTMYWYEYLFNQMGSNLDAFIAAPISFITFNYDRSLEHFLYLSLRGAYGLSKKDASAVIAALNIVHVYGQLAPLDFIDSKGRPYNTKVTDSTVAKSVAAIKIMGEEVVDSPAIGKARNFISESEILSFVGFGYHRVNIQRLAIDSVFKGNAIIGSAYQLGQDEKRRASNLISQHRIEFGGYSQNNLGFLQNQPVFR